MAKTPSTMLPLGTPLPPFALPDGSGRVVSSEEFSDKPLLVAFICNHCPFVVHIRPALVTAIREWQQAGLSVVAINANDAEAYPDDAPEAMVKATEAWGLTAPYLFDESQRVAHAFEAACTPEFYLFSGQHRLVYRGQFDDSRPGNGEPIDGSSLRGAVTALLAGKEVAGDQVPSLGCNIKWRPGNAPSYFAG